MLSTDGSDPFLFLHTVKTPTCFIFSPSGSPFILVCVFSWIFELKKHCPFLYTMFTTADFWMELRHHEKLRGFLDQWWTAMCTYHHIINLLLCERKHRNLNLSRLTRMKQKFSENKNHLRRSDTAIWVWTTYSQMWLQMFQYAAAAVWVFFITVLNRLHTCYSSTNLFISLAVHLSIQQKFLPAGHRH